MTDVVLRPLQVVSERNIEATVRALRLARGARVHSLTPGELYQRFEGPRPHVIGQVLREAGDMVSARVGHTVRYVTDGKQAGDRRIEIA